MSINDIQNKLNELKKGYLKKMETNIEELQSLAQKFEQSNVERIYSIVHTTSGTSGMYGLHKLSESSTEFELYLKPLRNDAGLIKEDEFIEKLTHYIETIQKMMKEE